jgi:hypothetical protein
MLSNLVLYRQVAILLFVPWQIVIVHELGRSLLLVPWSSSVMKTNDTPGILVFDHIRFRILLLLGCHKEEFGSRYIVLEVMWICLVPRRNGHMRAARRATKWLFSGRFDVIF